MILSSLLFSSRLDSRIFLFSVMLQQVSSSSRFYNEAGFLHVRQEEPGSVRRVYLLINFGPGLVIAIHIIAITTTTTTDPFIQFSALDFCKWWWWFSLSLIWSSFRMNDDGVKSPQSERRASFRLVVVVVVLCVTRERGEIFDLAHDYACSRLSATNQPDWLTECPSADWKPDFASFFFFALFSPSSACNAIKSIVN